MNRLSTSMACNLTVDFAKMLSFSSYGWLTVIAFLDSSETAHLYVSEVLKQPRVTKMDSSFQLS